MKRVIITGDDFGLSVPVNEAIEKAHREGILTTASLMVAGGATMDAVERARRLPSLRVGLHVVLVDGVPLLSSERIPSLVDRGGEFSSHLVRAGFNFFFRPKVRGQLEDEIRAQFQAFRNTGLPLDHVNTHHHIHLHPTVSGLLLEVGRPFGMKAMRFPYEPFVPSWRASKDGFSRKITAWFFLSPWLSLLKRRLDLARIRSNEFVFGRNDNGRMTVDLLRRILKQLPEGVTEIYFHVATRREGETAGIAAGDNAQAELEALTSPDIHQALRESGIERIAFSDL